MTRPLDYESPQSQDTLRMERGDDGGVTITVPTRRSVSRFARRWIWDDLEAIFIAPLLLPLSWLIFKLFATRKPRAILHLTPREFILIETSDDGLGIDESRRAWPLHEIGVLRANRYENGLYVTLNQRDAMTLLADVPAEEIAIIGKILAEALQHLRLQ